MEALYLGNNHSLIFKRWAQARGLNQQYADVLDAERYGALIEHVAPDGSPCASSVVFEGQVAVLIHPDDPVWKVQSWAPLTLTPSLLCRRCGDHGFIRNGSWIPA